MENIIFESTKYLKNSEADEICGILTFIQGQEMSVPLDPANRHYAEILRQVEAGTLTIADAE
jgi:hypothetical protein